MERVPTVSGTANLLDILDRVLDKGLVIAGDVRISLANVFWCARSTRPRK
jgi:hypothetical protein